MKSLVLVAVVTLLVQSNAYAELSNESSQTSVAYSMSPVLVSGFTTLCETEGDCSKDVAILNERIVQAAMAGEITAEEATQLINQTAEAFAQQNKR